MLLTKLIFIKELSISVTNLHYKNIILLLMWWNEPFMSKIIQVSNSVSWNKLYK